MTVAAGDTGLAVVDVADPELVSPVATIPLPASAHAIAFVGSHIAIATDAGATWMVDVSEPLAARTAGSFSLPTHPVAVHLDGDDAFVLDALSGLHTLDVSDPHRPKQLALYGVPGATQLAMHERRALYPARNP